MSNLDRFVAHDASFRSVTGEAPRLEHVVACDAHEGPVYAADEDALYVTSLPADAPNGRPAAAILRIGLAGERFPTEPGQVRVLPSGTTMPNGMTLDADGRLVVCEQGDLLSPACISRLDRATGEREVVVDQWRGHALNSPNDVVVASDGAIWFTDPHYGSLQGFRPTPELGDFVYRWDPATGTADVVADGFDKPNGLAFSPDGSTLYVTDSGANQIAGSFHVDRPHHVVAFDVVAGGRRLGVRRLLVVTTPGFPDGLKVDVDGRVYVSTSDGVSVLSPDGDPLGEIVVPGAVNFTFGGPHHNILFVTADTGVWAAVLATVGPDAPATHPIHIPTGV